MIHSIFGWSYPPGCNSVPGDEPDPPCMICWQFDDKCKCPVCDVCEVIGDPHCYMHHGLKLTEQQVALRLDAEMRDRIAIEDENEFWDQQDLERSEYPEDGDEQ